jgi:hypothetical protein
VASDSTNSPDEIASSLTVTIGKGLKERKLYQKLIFFKF